MARIFEMVQDVAMSEQPGAVGGVSTAQGWGNEPSTLLRTAKSHS